MSLRSRQFANYAALLLVASAISCGGGSSSGGSQPPPTQTLVITSPSNLPGTLQNASYSYTLTAANGQGALKWSISPLPVAALFVDGLTMDANTGVLSGTANFLGVAGFTAHVSDSASHTASKQFSLAASGPLQPLQPQSFTVSQYQDVLLPVAVSGGVQPLTVSIAAGSLPAGLRLTSDVANQILIRGSSIPHGTFQATVTVQDSFSPPEVVSGLLTVIVSAPPFSVAGSLPSKLPTNRPFNGRVVAVGGVPPYHFAQSSGTRPPGLGAVDPNGGQIQGTPTTTGSYNFTVDVTDSSQPVQTASGSYSITVADPIGRNDTVAAATPLENGQITASTSPYIDPPDNAPLPADNDYYKLVSYSGATVHIETQAQRWWGDIDPIDTVLELVDGNNTRLTTCRQPNVTTNTFTSACINDDIGGNPHVLDSALDFKVPGAPNTATTFYVHVLDFRGLARPEMQYALDVSGLASPLKIQPNPLPGAARTLNYWQQLSAANGLAPLSWTLASGNLPPGISIDSTGVLTGIPTTNGGYTFTVRVTDGSTPTQTATAQKSITVVDPVKITSPATWPDACLNQPYTFAVQTTGGLPPLRWNFDMGLGGIYLDPSSGVFSGTPTVAGTFSGTVSLSDETGYFVTQTITLTIKQCP